MTAFDEIIVRVFLDNNAYNFLKATSESLLAVVDTGLDARLAIGIFAVTATVRLVPLRIANTHRHVWHAANDIAWSGVVLYAGVSLFRLIAEVLQIPLWPDEVRVNFHAVAWIMLLAIFPFWLLQLRQWIILPKRTAP